MELLNVNNQLSTFEQFTFLVKTINVNNARLMLAKSRFLISNPSSSNKRDLELQGSFPNEL